jgi:drug/metabolite transporter (DMT)-like permease
MSKKEPKSVTPHSFSPPTLAAFGTLGAIWGSAFVFIKIATWTFPPCTLVALRMLLGFLSMTTVVLPFIITKEDVMSNFKNVLLTKEVLPKLMFMGFFNNVIPFMLVAVAVRTIQAGVASILDASIPLFAQPLAYFFLPGQEAFTVKRGTGILMGFLGVVLVCLQGLVDEDASGTKDGQFPWGYILVTLASLSYAIASVFARRTLTDVNGMLGAWGQIFFGALFSVVIALVVDFWFDLFDYGENYSFMNNVDALSIVAIAYLGIVSTVCAYLLYFYLVQRIGSVKQTMVGFLLPVFGAAEGALFLGEWNGVSPWFIVMEVVGSMLICCGIALASLFESKQTNQEQEDGYMKYVCSEIPSTGALSINTCEDGDKVPLLAFSAQGSQ